MGFMKKNSLILSLFVFLLGFNSNAQELNFKPSPVIVIHGGAGFMNDSLLSEDQQAEVKGEIQKALNAGYAILENGGLASEAVVAAIEILENSPHFNAGKGAVMNKEGKHELDASIMRGSDLQAGAVASLSNVKNPIVAALAVMNNSDHVMLAGEGAEKFAKSQNLELVKNDYFTTPDVLREWESSQNEGNITPQRRTFEKFGTVGCVALDSKGNIAAGTSTGGMMNKSFGRIGDSPIIGAGTYADNQTCGVSCTGQGEYYIRLGVAKEISDQIAFGEKSLEKSMTYTLGRLTKMEAFGGMIAIDKSGNVVMDFNTPSMYRGMRKGKKSTIQLFGKAN